MARTAAAVVGLHHERLRRRSRAAGGRREGEAARLDVDGQVGRGRRGRHPVRRQRPVGVARAGHPRRRERRELPVARGLLAAAHAAGPIAPAQDALAGLRVEQADPVRPAGGDLGLEAELDLVPGAGLDGLREAGAEQGAGRAAGVGIQAEAELGRLARRVEEQPQPVHRPAAGGEHAVGLAVPGRCLGDVAADGVGAQDRPAPGEAEHRVVGGVGLRHHDRRALRYPQAAPGVERVVVAEQRLRLRRVDRDLRPGLEPARERRRRHLVVHREPKSGRAGAKCDLRGERGGREQGGGERDRECARQGAWGRHPTRPYGLACSADTRHSSSCLSHGANRRTAGKA